LLQELPSCGVGVVHIELNGLVSVSDPLAAGSSTPHPQHGTIGGRQEA
jgi:hypothetical protein